MGVAGTVPTVAAIKRVVADSYGVTVADLEGPSRRRAHTRPRQVAMTLSHLLTRHSKEHISVMFHKHPNAAAWSIATTHQRRREDEALRRDLNRLTLELIGRG